MANLKLKHIAPYLPYGLKGKSSNGTSSTIDEVIGTYSDFNLTLKARVNDHNIVDYGCDLVDFTPHFRPLSDLTKEITNNGKTFVPIVEMLKELSLYDLINCTFEYESEYDECYVVAINENKIEIDGLVFDYNVFKIMYRSPDGEIDYKTYNNQTDALNLLYKYHFDIHNLIEQGLAIDINTI